MLRQATRRLLGFGQQQQRLLTTSASCMDDFASPAGPKEFSAKWSKIAPSNMDLPQFPSNFLKAEATGESKVSGDNFPVNFYTPHGLLSNGEQKDTVVLPGVDGDFGLKANHVPIISQLRPGIVELHSGTEVAKWFISGGFAFVHPNGVADICVLEAATLDQIDPAAVKSALATASSQAGQGDEYEQAVARTAVELYAALEASLDAKA
eukprot:gene32224-16783_t